MDIPVALRSVTILSWKSMKPLGISLSVKTDDMLSLWINGLCHRRMRLRSVRDYCPIFLKSIIFANTNINLLPNRRKVSTIRRFFSWIWERHISFRHKIESVGGIFMVLSLQRLMKDDRITRGTERQ